MFPKRAKVRRRCRTRLAGVLAFAGLLIGCGSRALDLREAGDPANEGACGRTAIPDWSHWGLTLSRVVVGDKVDFARLVQDHEALDRFLISVSRWGPTVTPERFPDRDSRLVYYINSHNALVLRSLVELSSGGNPPAVVPSDVESRFRFLVDGRWQSAADLRATAEGLAGDDWRVRLVLYDARVAGPPLPPHALLPDLLDAQLDRHTRWALLSPGIIRVEHGESKRLLVWAGLYAIRDRLVREYEARLSAQNANLLNVLLEWSDRPRRAILNSAVGYEIALLPADPTLSALEPPPAEQAGLGAVLRSIRSITILRP